MTIPDRFLKFVPTGISIALYLACLPFETFCVQNACSGWPGYGILIFGWMGALTLSAPANLIWFANPILFSSWGLALTKQPGYSVLAAAGAAVIGGCFLLAKVVCTNEAGILDPITGYRIGYWLWLTSMIAQTAGMSLIIYRRPKAY